MEKNETCRSGWWLMLLFMWDALFRRKPPDEWGGRLSKPEDAIHNGEH